MELCGGTHVTKIPAEIGLFKIISETGISSGVRRIEAVAGPAVLEYLNVRDAVVRDLSERFKAKPEELPDRITTLQNDLKSAQKELDALRSELAVTKSDQLLDKAENRWRFEGAGGRNARRQRRRPQDRSGNGCSRKLGAGAVVLGSIPEEGKVSLVAAFSPEVIEKKATGGQVHRRHCQNVRRRRRWSPQPGPGGRAGCLQTAGSPGNRKTAADGCFELAAC